MRPNFFKFILAEFIGGLEPLNLSQIFFALFIYLLVWQRTMSFVIQQSKMATYTVCIDA